MCFKMLMWTILVLGSYLQGAYAEKAKSTSSTSTIAITPTNTGIIPAAIKTSLNETTTQSTPTTISISTILTAKLSTAKVSTTGPTTIAVKTEASSPTTNSIPTDPQSAIVTIKTPEPKDTTIISTSATSALFNATSVTASTILTSNVTNGTDAPSDQSTLKNSLDTVTISSPTGFNLTTTTNESLVNHSAADKIPTTNSKAAETTATTSAAATTTSAAATTASAAATTASAAATTASAATTTSAASAATTTSAAATTKTSTAAAAAAAAGAGATRTATTITTRTTAATTTTTTTSIKPQSQAMEPKLIAMEVTPNTKGTNYEQICALLIKNNRKTVNCTINGHDIDGDFIVESIQLPSLPHGKDQKHPTTATPPKTVDSGTPTENQGEDTQMTLIAILASSGALALILIAFAVYCSCHRLSYRKNQQHLTEELQTVENGYHDNPTLEVMEVQPEVQEKKFALEKKLALNGEFNDSWIVPFDNLAKDDIPDEEDTHL